MMEMSSIMHIVFAVSIVRISTILFIGTAGLITTRFSMIHGTTDLHGHSHGDGDGDIHIMAGDTRDTAGDIQAMVGDTIHLIMEAAIGLDGGEEATTLLITQVTRYIQYTREIQEDIPMVNVGQQEQTW
jgi:hypothetical protein